GAMTAGAVGSSWLIRRASRAAWASGGRTAKLYSMALLPRRRWPSQPSRSASFLMPRSVLGRPGRPVSSRAVNHLCMAVTQQALEFTGLAGGLVALALQAAQLGVEGVAAVGDPAAALLHQPVGEDVAVAHLFQERGAVERQVVVDARRAGPGVQHVLAHVVAGQARHAGGDFVAVDVGGLEDLGDQLADGDAVVAVAGGRADRLRHLEQVKRAVVFSVTHVQTSLRVLRCGTGAQPVSFARLARRSARFGRWRLGVPSRFQRSGHSTTGSVPSAWAMARSMRGYGACFTARTGRSVIPSWRASSAGGQPWMRSWYLIHSQRMAGLRGMSFGFIATTILAGGFFRPFNCLLRLNIAKEICNVKLFG